MPDIEYKLFFDNAPATRERLDRVEEIRVEQEVDMIWQGRIKIALRADKLGRWTHEDEAFMTSFARIRVEIRNDGESFVPLIDGPIVGSDSQMSSEPGQSWITLNVRDDSVHLNREERIVDFENRLDHEVAEDVFAEYGEFIAETIIDDTPPSGSVLAPRVFQRGCAMEILRSLARRQGMHAYVLPGETPGKSVGVFAPFPARPDGLPALILLGPERNIDRFDVENNAGRPSRVSASTLSITDKSVTTRTSSFRDLDFLGEEDPFEDESETAIRILPPHQGESVDLEHAAAAEAARSSYAFTASGSVRMECYRGVLEPYRVVTALGMDGRLSGDYLITRVSHELTRSVYSQSFTVRRNAKSAGSGGGAAANDAIGSIF